jgi:hypothetical protein
MYADYTFYTETYKGSLITEAAFNELSERASEFLEMATFGAVESASHDTAYTDKIKKACCAVAEAIKKNRDGGDITSESTGKVSKSYAKSETSETSRMMNAALFHLSSTGLLYRGLY